MERSIASTGLSKQPGPLVVELASLSAGSTHSLTHSFIALLCHLAAMHGKPNTCRSSGAEDTKRFFLFCFCFLNNNLPQALKPLGAQC
jgi:hypothetical protein